MPTPTPEAQAAWKKHLKKYPHLDPVIDPDMPVLADLTCADCTHVVGGCPWVFDTYNTNGDCLALK